MADLYFSGQGKVYLQERDATGAIGPMYWVGDADVFSTAGTEQTVSFQESWSGQRTVVVDVLQSTELTATVGIRNVSGKNLAKALFGLEAASAGASVTGESVAAFNSTGNVIPLANPNVSSVVVKKGVTTLVLDTDYTLDAAAGTISIKSGSTQVTSPTVATVLTVDYTYGAYSSKVQALASSQKEYILRFEGKDMANSGSRVHVTCKRWKPGVLANFSWLGTDIAQMSLTGKLLPAQDVTTTGISQFMEVIVV